MADDLITYQEFEESSSKLSFIKDAVDRHKSGKMYQTAKIADRYSRQLNDTIMNYVQTIMSISGNPIEDFTASNNKIASNFFHRLNTQRNMYSLGNGVTFAGGDATKKKLGNRFDEDIQDAGYFALIHGLTFCFWNVSRIHVFPITEFVPIWDENDGTLRAGIRFWQLSKEKPMTYVLYEEDGYTKYRKNEDSDALVEIQPKRAYKQITRKAPADESAAVVGEENYGSLPIVSFWGSKRKQSTLIGMREAIDSFDLIRSGFANDLSDVSQIYWIVENAGGMSDKDLARFRDRLHITHIANVDTSDGGKVVPYAQEIPYQARKQYLDDIRAGIYEDFGALDVHTVAAGATNDHIDAAYQPMDEEASDFERRATECIKQVLTLVGVDDYPIYKRNRISNQREQVEIVTMEAQWLDEETILRKLPNISPDEIAEIMKSKDEENMARMPVFTVIEEMNDGELDEADAAA